ncbi:MAG: FHA domain-containing protein [Chloroflexi bacterium]|nr:MAG: FHA domain-containing protein [Chloroflexota bacterium]
MPTLETGQVFERYRIIRWLGSGVSGESYEAEDSMLLRKVTLKLIHPRSMLPDSARRQFFREMQGISALNHAYLAPVLDYGEINGTLYVARKFVSSGSLLGTEGRLWFRPPLSVSDAIHYTHQLAQTLHSIHARGYLHGAITFSNILVLRGPNLDNEPNHAPFILTDVGLANFVRRFGQQQTSPLPVTAAPEQLGKRVIPASDQFALAVLLYFWLAGRPPYLGTPEEIEHFKLTETITPLSTINTRVSIEQDGMVLRALSVYAEDRYPSILAFADALLKTLPPKHVAVPATEPARFDGFTAQPQQPQASTIIAEPTIANSAQQEGHELDSAHTTTPVQENASEQPHVMAAVPDFGKIPETDPIVSFEPLSQIQIQPEQPALSQEDAPEDQPTAEPEDEAMPVHIDEHELETPETTSDADHELEAPRATQPALVESPQASNEPQPVPETTPPQQPVEPIPQTVPDVPQPLPEPATPHPLPEKEPVQPVPPPAPGPLTPGEPEQPVPPPTPGPLTPPVPDVPQPLPEPTAPPTIPQKPPQAEVAAGSTPTNQQELPPREQDTQPFTAARVIITSPYTDQPYEVRLDSDEITIGRAGSSTILLDQDNLTSRHHALLKCEGNRYVLFDMRSANGVFVNGQKIAVEKGYELLDGDHISIGNYELIFRFNVPGGHEASNGNELKVIPDYEVSNLI